MSNYWSTLKQLICVSYKSDMIISFDNLGNHRWMNVLNEQGGILPSPASVRSFKHLLE